METLEMLSQSVVSILMENQKILIKFPNHLPLWYILIKNYLKKLVFSVIQTIIHLIFISIFLQVAQKEDLKDTLVSCLHLLCVTQQLIKMVVSQFLNFHLESILSCLIIRIPRGTIKSYLKKVKLKSVIPMDLFQSHLR